MGVYWHYYPMIAASQRLRTAWIAMAIAAALLPRSRAQGIIRIAGANSADLGEFLAWEKRTARFLVRNDGDEPLVITKIRHGCGCALATTAPLTIAPGQTTTIELTTIPGTLVGAFEKRAYVESSDSRNPVIPLFFRGRAVPLVEILPGPRVYADRIATNRTWRQRFILRSHHNDVRLGVPFVESTYDVETDFAAEGLNMPREHVLNLGLKPTHIPGRWRCVLRIPVLQPSGHLPVEIVVTGKIGNELSAVPHHVALDTSSRDVSATVVLRFVGEPGARPMVQNLVYPASKGLTFTPLSAFEGSTMRLRIAFTTPFLTTLRQENIIMLSIGLPGAVPARLRCVAKP